MNQEQHKKFHDRIWENCAEQYKSRGLAHLYFITHKVSWLATINYWNSQSYRYEVALNTDHSFEDNGVLMRLAEVCDMFCGMISELKANSLP